VEASAARAERPDGAPTEPTPLARADRRTTLLEAAAELVADGDVDAVSMESVAERAGVSRALVYKHFANRSDLLSALYERESAVLHAHLAGAVQGATSLSAMLRALIRGALSAQASRGATLAALASGGGRSPAHREVQRRRDRQTVRYFTRQAVHELGLEEADARAALGIVLGSIPVVLAQWRANPTPAQAARLEDAYVAVAMGGLTGMGRPAP